MLTELQLAELERIKEKFELLASTPPENLIHEEFMLAAIRINPLAMLHADLKLRDNDSFVLAALAINCDVYAYISDSLKDKEEVTAVAIRKDPRFYFGASERLKTDENYKNKTLKTNSWYPLIRLNKVLKNNFSEGMHDTFSIMLGDYGITTKMIGGELDPNQLKHGFVDITFVPQLANFLINYGLPSKPMSSNPFKFVKDQERANDKRTLRNISTSLGFGLELVRYGMASLATLIVLPVVAFVHILKYPYMSYYESSMLQLEGVIYDAHTMQPIPETTTLAEFVSRTDSSLSDLSGYRSSDITSYSSKNSEVSTYGSLHSTNPNLFFRPLNSDKPAQIRAQQLVTAFEINEKYDPNDSTSAATGRTFR